MVKDSCVSWLSELCVFPTARVVFVDGLESTAVFVELPFNVRSSAVLVCEDALVEVRCLRELGWVEAVVIPVVKVDSLGSASPPPWS